MSFRVNMHQFEKRDNSTKRPSGDGTVLWCNLRRGSSLITPMMEFDFGAAASDNPINYNYMYVPEFNRYYFIEDWTFSGGLWIASCICDVLATYKTEIGSTSLYILRASADSNGRVPDTMYPAKEGCSYSHVEEATPWVLSGGSFVLGVVNKTPTIGGICYYLLTDSQMTTFLTKLCENGFLNSANGFNTTDASLALQRSIVDPIQYVKSAVYIPISPSLIPGSAIGSMEVYGFDFGFGTLGAQTFNPSNGRYHVSKTFDIPKHPDVSRGEYLNQMPWSVYTMTIPPFGQVELDSSILANAAAVGAAVDVDLMTGLGILTISCNGCVVSRIEAQVGVPVQISQVSRDYVGAATSILSGAASVTAGALSGPAGIAGGIGAGVGAIGDAIKALTPRAQSVGSGGSYAQLRYSWRLDAQFFRPVDEDNAHNGRPLCEMRKPASLGGYMIIRDGDVAITGTSAEDSRVRDYLQTGFYYE